MSKRDKTGTSTLLPTAVDGFALGSEAVIRPVCMLTPGVKVVPDGSSNEPLPVVEVSSCLEEICEKSQQHSTSDQNHYIHRLEYNKLMFTWDSYRFIQLWGWETASSSGTCGNWKELHALAFTSSANAGDTTWGTLRIAAWHISSKLIIHFDIVHRFSDFLKPCLIISDFHEFFKDKDMRKNNRHTKAALWTNMTN